MPIEHTTSVKLGDITLSHEHLIVRGEQMGHLAFTETQTTLPQREDKIILKSQKPSLLSDLTRRVNPLDCLTLEIRDLEPVEEQVAAQAEPEDGTSNLSCPRLRLRLRLGLESPKAHSHCTHPDMLVIRAVSPSRSS